jgi:hypothetical protein
MSRELTSRAAVMAMGSNVAFSLRSLLRRSVLTPEFKRRTGLDPSNEHALTTLLSLALTLPFALAAEPPAAVAAALRGLGARGALGGFVGNLAVCGLAFYLYNDMQNIVLGALGPVPTAVGNTLKRVVIFVAL